MLSLSQTSRTPDSGASRQQPKVDHRAQGRVPNCPKLSRRDSMTTSEARHREETSTDLELCTKNFSPETMITRHTVYLRDVQRRPRILDVMEGWRNRKQLSWLMELFAEMFGCFILVYSGIGSMVNRMNAAITGQPVQASGIQVGLAVAFGIVFAIGVCGGTSPAYFNPGFTIAHCIFRGFPKRKAVGYIIAQILGAYIASMVVFYQYRFLVLQMEELLRQQGTLEQELFTGGGPAGIFAFYLPQGQSLGAAFLNEWVSSVFTGIVYWASIDPTNSIVTPVASPFVSALACGVTIWGFGAAGVALNSARDIGSRLWAITIWGLPASGGSFAAISALTNIPAMIFAVVLYEMLLGDSGRPVTVEALEQMRLASNRLPEDIVAEQPKTSEARIKEMDLESLKHQDESH